MPVSSRPCDTSNATGLSGLINQCESIFILVVSSLLTSEIKIFCLQGCNSILECEV